MQERDTLGIDPKVVNGPYDEYRKMLLELVGGIRIDEAPTGDGPRLAKQGKFHPFTVDKNGYLRVTVPEGTVVESTEVEVLLRIEQLMIEQRDLLLKIV
jgi:hypothetical protein